MEIIGEASNHISPEIKLKFIYFGIDTKLVWQIIKNDIPELKEKIKMTLQSFQ